MNTAQRAYAAIADCHASDGAWHQGWLGELHRASGGSRRVTETALWMMGRAIDPSGDTPAACCATHELEQAAEALLNAECG